MELALWGLFWILIALAFLGCFINKVPGPVLALVAVLMAKLCMTAGDYIEWVNVIIIAVLVVASILLVRQLPKWTSELGTYGKGAKWGSIIGSIAALILAPALTAGIENNSVGISLITIAAILTTFIFATAFEFISVKDFKTAAKNGGIAAFEYTCSTLIKLITVIYSVYLVFVH
ncbi:MAG: DUF456 family protein [Muribaculaceae bacterium]|nr:DUF456 family protein [Muribaculaceae bacterium]